MVWPCLTNRIFGWSITKFFSGHGVWLAVSKSLHRFTRSITNYVSVSVTCTALAVFLSPHCHWSHWRQEGWLPITREKQRPQTHRWKKQKIPQKEIKGSEAGVLRKALVSQSAWGYSCLQYVDKCHTMKHYSNFYSLENILSASVLLDINLQLFQHLKNLA